MHMNATFQKRLKKVLLYLALIMGAFIFLIPFFWTLSTSFKPDTQIFLMPPKWIPEPFTIVHYKEVFKYVPYAQFYKNTVYLSILNVLGSLFACPLAAYAFARLEWPGRDFLFLVTLSTMMLPSQVTMVPLFLVFRKLGWLNTLKPLWVPAFFGNAFFIFLLREFFKGLPAELDDAARVDGCTYFGIYWRVILPLVKPALTTVSIFAFMGTWNNFTGPLIYVRNYEAMPLALGLRIFQEAHGTEWGALMAASVMMILPIILLFFFLQRYFIQGIALTGIKG